MLLKSILSFDNFIIYILSKTLKTTVFKLEKQINSLTNNVSQDTYDTSLFDHIE